MRASDLVYKPASGLPGERGPIGPTGLRGPQGVQGIQGVPGSAGLDGSIGLTGPIGIRGASGPPGTGSEVFYTNINSTPSAVGGIETGSTFNNISVTAVLDQLLYPYQYPQFTNFYFSQSSPLEVGDSIPAGNKTFIWTASNSTNIQSSSVGITGLMSGLPANGSSVISIVGQTRNSPGNVSWAISGMNTKSQQISTAFSVNWYWAVYYGSSAASGLNSAGVAGLQSKILSTTGSRTYIMPVNDYKYICYPTSFSTLTTFKDQSTNLDVAMIPLTVVGVTNIFGITTNYNVHRTLNKLGAAINIVAS